MNTKAKILGVLILVTFYSCERKDSNHNTNKFENIFLNVFDKYGNDSVRNKIFEIAYKNESTAPSYLVFIAKNLNTGEIKEICTEAPFLSGAMHHEFGMGHDLKSSQFIDSLVLANHERFFEFENEKALKSISFTEYPTRKRIKEIASTLDLDYYVKNFGSNENVKFMEFDKDEYFHQLAFAHIMFNCGIITSRSSMGGNNIWFGYPSIIAPEIPDIEE
ncbi:hypothetical protein [Algoriphagus formosus]|uniref:Uncharacterized protein n=1 Tax=Algoriphagus formosus TaxID=2007308 RepID=A0A4R5VDW0_9BACT|nr:hypothetical protein [Algoriphagus aquimaris]TDK50527.1 hypothetical protein E1898_01165 [Algoriphagus aquimaris]